MSDQPHRASMSGGTRSDAAKKEETEDRFTLVGQLGQGGMGKVVAYKDHALGRTVAVKIPHKDRHAVEVLEREAKITGGLEHPNIIPIYDVGNDPEWGPFYVMRIVQQPSLEEALKKLRRGEGQHTHGRLMRFFIQVCHAVDYAHSRGVIHCDLKPENILLGSFGDVFVVDWGFAFQMGVDTTPPGGTPGCMPPEQLRRDPREIDRRTDVFALGAILYQLLTDYRPFPSVGFDRWDDAEIQGKPGLVLPAPPSVRAPDRAIPPQLDALCMRALALDKHERLESAGKMAAALEAFLEGVEEKKRKLARAEELCRSAADSIERYRDILGGRDERLGELTELRAQLPSWEAGERKDALWDAEDRHAVMESLAASTLQAAVTAYETALDEVPGHKPARLGLLSLYRAEHERAIDRGDDLDRARYEALSLEYDDGSFRDALAGGGDLLVALRPGAAEVIVHEVVERGARLVAQRERQRGQTPFESSPLDPGTYQVTLRREGRREIRCPVLIRAGREQRIDVDLSAGEPDDGEALIIAGAAFVGGHESNPHARERRRVDLGPFFLARLPVTFADYLVFVADCLTRGEAQADLHLPRTEDGDPYFRWDGKAFRADRIARWGGSPSTWPALPVFGIPLGSATAYAAWQSARTGKRYRIPTEWEWEKAARGVDGRAYPWGQRFDAALCKTREARPTPPAPEPVGAFATDKITLRCPRSGGRDRRVGGGRSAGGRAAPGVQGRRVVRLAAGLPRGLAPRVPEGRAIGAGGLPAGAGPLKSGSGEP
ncbi:MAG: SUMF1/EgtB/PvdO family nonheme iron enzyme [Byssovorax sp.]